MAKSFSTLTARRRLNDRRSIAPHGKRTTSITARCTAEPAIFYSLRFAVAASDALEASPAAAPCLLSQCHRLTCRGSGLRGENYRGAFWLARISRKAESTLPHYSCVSDGQWVPLANHRMFLCTLVPKLLRRAFDHRGSLHYQLVLIVRMPHYAPTTRPHGICSSETLCMEPQLSSAGAGQSPVVEIWKAANNPTYTCPQLLSITHLL